MSLIAFIAEIEQGQWYRIGFGEPKGGVYDHEPLQFKLWYDDASQRHIGRFETEDGAAVNFESGELLKLIAVKDVEALEAPVSTIVLPEIKRPGSRSRPSALSERVVG